MTLGDRNQTLHLRKSLKGQGQPLPYLNFFCQNKLSLGQLGDSTFPLEFGAENLTAAQKYIELTNSTKKMDPPPIYPSLDQLGGGVLISRLRF